MRLGLIGIAALASAAATPAAAADFVNGSFETHSCGTPADGFTALAAGSGCITGWTVDTGSVDLINGYWDAHHGTHSIDLAGNEPGSISQVFDTVVGQLYSVDYWLSGNPDGGDLQKWGIISAVDGGVTASATFLGLQGASHDNMNYAKWNFQFTAAGNATKLTFASAPGEGFYGAALDSVSVAKAVPEPGTWAMLLLGFFSLGGLLRRSRTRPLRPNSYA